MFRYFPIKTVSLYLIKEFLKIFALIIFSISILVFIVDFMEFFPNIQKFSIPPVDAIKIVVFRIPNMLESFLQFLILLTTIFTVIKIASRSELTVLYVNGFSTWKILKIYSYLVFVIGLVVIFFLNFLFSVLAKQSKLMENRYSRKENEYFIESNSGIWFRQIDPETNVEFIVRAKKVYVNELRFLVDSNGEYKQRYNVNTMILSKDYFILKGVAIFDKNKQVDFKNEILLKTNVSQDFMKKQIQNKYEDVNLIPLYSLNKLIKEFKNLGFDTHKFMVKKHNLLITPFSYVLMVCIGILFSNNNQRTSKYSLMIFKTICAGIIVFIIQNTLFELGAVNKINFLLSTWGVLIFLFLTIYTLLIKKIELS